MADQNGAHSDALLNGTADKSPDGTNAVEGKPLMGASPTKASSPRSPIDNLAYRYVMRRNSSLAKFIHTNSVTEEPDEERLKDIDLTQVPWWTSQRLRMAVLWFFGFLALYTQRVNLSIAIVSMVGHPLSNDSHSVWVNDTNSTSYDYNITAKTPVDNCPTDTLHKETVGQFHWNKELQGLILGSFFWGYLFLQVPGGWLSEKFGAKKVVAGAMFPVAILSIISPFAARFNPFLFLAVRVLLGIGEGVLYPAAQAFWAGWSPLDERSRLVGLSYAGGQFGNAMIFPIGGYLCAYGFDGGWPSVFYVIGTVGFIWCVFWTIFAHDTPAESPRISEIERKYIEYSIGKRKTKNKTTPWLCIAKSRGVWAILVAHVCGNYGIYMLLTQLPTYMKDVLKFDIKANGVFSMIPYLCFWVLIGVSGIIADLIIHKQILSVAWTRKLMSFIGLVGPALMLVGAGYMECTQQTEAVVLLTVAVGLCGVHFSGHFINHGDIAPRYAGTLFGITNTAATVPGIIAPYVVGAMTKHGTREEWLATFYVAAAVYCFGALFYLVLGQGEIQPWALGDDREEGHPLKNLDQSGHELEEADNDNVTKKAV